MVVRISDKTQNYSKVTKLLVKPKYIARTQALSESAIEYVYKGIPKKMEVLLELYAQMKKVKLIKEDVVKNEIVVRPAKIEGFEIKDYIKDRPVDLTSFNYTNV